MAVDLHAHTTVSDGRRTPAELVLAAASAGLSALAITDHDHVGGILAAREAASPLRLEIVAGVELTTLWEENEVHLLGYFVEPDVPGWETFLARQRQHRLRRMERFIENLHAQGIVVSLQAVLDKARHGTVGRPHLARTLIENGIVSSEEQAFVRFLKPGCQTWVAREGPSPEEAIALIHQAGGVASLAHPGATSGMLEPGALETMAAAGLDAVEVVHPAHDMHVRQHLLDRCRLLNLLPSGGSDDHGNTPRGPSALGRELVPDTWLAALRLRRPLEV